MSEFHLGDTRCRLLRLVLALDDFTRDAFLEAYPDACLLQVPVEGAFPELEGSSAAPLDTQKVTLAELTGARRSKRVDDATVHFLTAKQDGPPLLVGRAEECDIVLEAAGVSRKHAELRKALGRWHVVDLDSNNGTFVDKEQVAPGVQTALKERSQVWFASYRALFLYSEELYNLAKNLRTRAK